MDLPAKFVRHNEVDLVWLRGLPDLLDALARRWSLTVEAPFPEIEINYVAPAWRADGTRCVFKVSRHIGETRTEIAALRLWNGAGAACLLDAAEDCGAMLIERLEPGTMLSDIADADDDRATEIAASILRDLWQPVPEAARLGLRSLESWCAGFDRNRETLQRGVAGFPADVFERADALRRDLLASTGVASVLHGDLHHFNVLRAQRADWLAIDPKGLAGDRAFDVCQFFRNPSPVPTAVNSRRLDIFCAELDLDRARTRDWCFVHAVLDACWDFEDGRPWHATLAYAHETLSF